MESYHPARRINNRNGLSKVIGLFSSKKMNVQIAWESQLERDFCYLLEFDKNIEKYFSQPKTFFLNYDGNEVRYTPDFYVEYSDKCFEYLEVKFSNSLENPKIVNKLKLLIQYFKIEKINYKIVYEDEIRLQPRLENIKFLYKYSRLSFEEKFNFNFDTSLEKLSNLIDIKYIYAAMYNNFINFDVNREINGDLKISLRLKL